MLIGKFVLEFRYTRYPSLLFALVSPPPLRPQHVNIWTSVDLQLLLLDQLRDHNLLNLCGQRLPRLILNPFLSHHLPSWIQRVQAKMLREGLHLVTRIQVRV